MAKERLSGEKGLNFHLIPCRSLEKETDINENIDKILLITAPYS